MRRLALERRAVRFAAATLALALMAISPAAVRAAPDLIAGDAGADAFATAYAAATNASLRATRALDILPPATSFAADAAGWERALRRDADLKFSPSSGRLVYTCGSLADDSLRPASRDMAFAVAPAPSAIPASGSGFAWPNEADPLASNAFMLHSRPIAAKKIVLDFTGHTLRKGTVWGTTVSKIGDVPIVTPPYDLDNYPSSFSTEELQVIVSIWRQVAEDYSPWDIDVTTEEPPGTDDQADAALAGVGLRVIIGKNTGWFDNGGGGGAFIGSFGDAYTGPAAFVFAIQPHHVANAASHEVGHALGLMHHGTVANPDGTGASEYYYGHGYWAPIMGCPYGKSVIQWSKGDYPYASAPGQDDIAVISRTLAPAPWSGGGRDWQTAPLVTPLTQATDVQQGIFTSSSEWHNYKFVAVGPGNVSLQLSANPQGIYGESRTHLAVQVWIWRPATNQVLAPQFKNVGPTGIDYNIPDTPSYLFSIPAAGDYYIQMAATGNGNASTGYTKYGTSGTYALSVSGDIFLPIVPASPNLKCLNATTLQLTSAAGKCNSGVAVQAKDVYTTADGRVATVSPAIGTVLAGGTTTLFTATLDQETCTTTVTVTVCNGASLMSDTVTCRNPTYTLAAGQCAGVAVPAADLYQLSGATAGSPPSGTATTTLTAISADGILAPGKYQVQVTASAGGDTCAATVTVNPCKPVVISTTTAISVPSAPGVCGGNPAPSAVVSAATLGRGASSINARTSATGKPVAPPLKAAKYYVSVNYPGGITSLVSAGAVRLAIADIEDPVAAIKPAIVRDAGGFICAKGRSATATQACVSVSTTTTGVLYLSDNCGASSLTRAYQCASSQNACPSTLSAKTSKLCVPVRQGGGRIEATYLLTVTDKGGRKAQVQIPIAGYHNRDAPAYVTCYSA